MTEPLPDPQQPARIDLPLIPTAPPVEQRDARLRFGVMVTTNPATATIGGSTIAVPVRVLGNYLPIAGDPVQILEQDGDHLVLGPTGWGVRPPRMPTRLFHAFNNTGGSFGTSLLEIPLTVAIDIMGGFHAPSSRYILPWTGVYRFHTFVVIAGGTAVSYVSGAAMNAGGGWSAFQSYGPISALSTIVIQATSPPLTYTAGVTASLGLFASGGSHNYGGGFGRNNELVIEWLGPEFVG